MMKISYVLVGDEGYMLDVVLLDSKDEIGNDIPVPKNYVPPNSKKRLFKPKWDFILNDWVEGLSDQEVKEREKIVASQENKPSEDEVLAMAVMELAEIILNGGVE